MAKRCFLIAITVSLMFSSIEAWSDSSTGNLAEQAYFEGNYKKALLLYEQALKEATPQERGPLLAEQAAVYYKDQNQEKVFLTLEINQDRRYLCSMP